MIGKKPIIAHLENAQISVGLAYKKWMDVYTKNNLVFSEPDMWRNIEQDAIQMIKSSANVMRKLKEPTKHSHDNTTELAECEECNNKEDAGQNIIDDYVEDKNK